MSLAKKALIAGITLLAGVSVFTTKSNASDVYTADEVIGNICAGVAVDIELDTMPSQEQIDAIIEEATAWKNPGALVMAHATDEVNIRESASTDSAIIGKLYSNCGGYIVEYTDTWTKISSGNAEGWVCNDYLYFGDEAQAIADEIGNYWAEVTATELNVRSEANTESDVLGTVGYHHQTEGEHFQIGLTFQQVLLILIQLLPLLTVRVSRSLVEFVAVA